MTTVDLEFKPEDLWVGVFWKKTKVIGKDFMITRRLDVWICLIPCVPIHITHTEVTDALGRP